jgi:hypothetical protein
MKPLKIFASLLLMIGFPIAVLSVFAFDGEHSVWFIPVAFICAFTGTALVFGLSGFKNKPKYIGNINDGTLPEINQNWAVFFITLIINLLIANLCGEF